MQNREQLTSALVRLILAAAVLSAPLFLFAEGFQAKYVARVAISNGSAALLCAGLLQLLRRGHVQAAGLGLVLGLLALVGTLAWNNGEPVHVNVINFVLVTLLAGSLLDSRWLLLVGGACALCMVGIALRQDVGGAEDPWEQRLESIVQFLPTYLVIVGILVYSQKPTEGRPQL